MDAMQAADWRLFVKPRLGPLSTRYFHERNDSEDISEDAWSLF